MKEIQVPKYYNPWPHQLKSWIRRDKNIYTYDVKLWCRQAGKDTDDLQYLMYKSWGTPGSQSAYVGLNNVWIRNNIFKKTIDSRTHWMDYPEDDIDVKDTQREVSFLNNPDNKAQARIKFIGFQNDEGLIGSSYDNFVVSEASLYRRNAFQYIEPIWDRKVALGAPLSVMFNGTPRGMRNVFYDMLKTWTKEEDPEAFPGAHEDCYVDKVTIEDLIIPDGNGGWKHMYNEEDIEKLKDRYIRAYGDLNLFYQENYCDFTIVNSGLVYKQIEQLRNDGRYCDVNIEPSHPVYMAWDISSKGKTSDATACVVFQFINGRMIMLDWYESRGKPLVECVQDLAARSYFHMIRFAALPWDSERSASSETPIEECRKMFPNINWHSLSMERVDRGINEVRKLMPNMYINKANCEWLMECFESYEYTWLGMYEDWSPRPKHDRHSHLMDAVRYAAMAVKEIDYLQLNAYGIDDIPAGEYDYFGSESKKAPSIWDKRKSNAKKFETY